MKRTTKLNEYQAACTITRERIQKAEMGHWQQLLVEYTGELREEQAQPPDGTKAWQKTDDPEDAERKASKAMDRCNVQKAKIALKGGRRAPLVKESGSGLQTQPQMSSQPSQL